MGKRIYVQRRGRGTSKFRSSSHKRKGAVRYLRETPKERETYATGEVKDIIHDAGRGAPIMKILMDDGRVQLALAPESIRVGQQVFYGNKAPFVIGSVMQLSQIPENIPIFNIEITPGDGGKLIRASGNTAFIRSRDASHSTIELARRRFKRVENRCRATIGVIGSSGRTEKPFMKAGSKYHSMKARGKPYPTVRGCAKNACDHPHGGGGHQGPPRSTCVSRDAPPGRKVGLIAARRTGRKRGRQ